MRLLNTKSLTLGNFSDTTRPDYAILSHTWISEEITFQDFAGGHIKNDNVRRKRAFPKVRGACKQAVHDGYEWIWIDSLCIDKSSSSELQEAINSMWSWYKEACICYAYLEDVPDERRGWMKNNFQKSRWFTRGWTLQELIAPFYVTFFAANWKSIGTKLRRVDEIHETTGIAKTALQIWDLANHHAAEIMSWAAHREVSREEDIAYSLMGLFDINMPMLYGEGGVKAFLRLQEAIYRHWTDDTLFLWTYTPRTSDPTLLAEHPRQFCRTIGCNRDEGRGWESFPKAISYRDIRHCSPKLEDQALRQELSLHRHGVQANMVTIKQDVLVIEGQYPKLVIIDHKFNAAGANSISLRRPREFPQLVAVLEVSDSQGHLYCLPMHPGQFPNTFQRLRSVGLLRMYDDLLTDREIVLPRRLPILIEKSGVNRRAGLISGIRVAFESDYFPLYSWRDETAGPGRPFHISPSALKYHFTMSRDWGIGTTAFRCSLRVDDPSVSDPTRQIVVGLAHSGQTKDSLRIVSVMVEEGGVVTDQTPRDITTDEYRLDLFRGPSVLISVRQTFAHLRFRFQMTRIVNQ